ncbi:MAG: aldo/keto reductase [Armatimonadota bacterium]
MEYAVLGKSGRTVSRLGFGGATAGLKNYLGEFDPDEREHRDAVLGAIRRACELGVNYFDTAAGYGEGRSERIFGEALEGTDPEAIFLATKAGVGDGSGHAVRRSLEGSLSNLRRDWIDLLQIHGSAYSQQGVTAALEKGGMLDEMERMREEGLVRHLGFTCEAVNEQLYRLLKTDRFDVIQMQYNLLFQHPYDPTRKSGVFYDAAQRGMGIVTMRTLTSGMLQKWVAMVNPENTCDYTPALLQFQLSNPLVDVALVGMRMVEEVEENVAICSDLSGRLDLDELHRRYV